MSMQNESDFLHDLSNPAAAALFWSELLSEQKIPSPELALKKLHTLLLEIKTRIEDRRSELATQKITEAA